jgi:hypothetical protein
MAGKSRRRENQKGGKIKTAMQKNCGKNGWQALA